MAVSSIAWRRIIVNVVETTSLNRRREIIRLTGGAFSGYPQDVKHQAVTAALGGDSTKETVNAIDRVLSTWETEASAWDRIMCA